MNKFIYNSEIRSFTNIPKHIESQVANMNAFDIAKELHNIHKKLKAKEDLRGSDIKLRLSAIRKRIKDEGKTESYYLERFAPAGGFKD